MCIFLLRDQVHLSYLLYNNIQRVKDSVVIGAIRINQNMKSQISWHAFKLVCGFCVWFGFFFPPVIVIFRKHVSKHVFIMQRIMLLQLLMRGKLLQMHLNQFVFICDDSINVNHHRENLKITCSTAQIGQEKHIRGLGDMWQAALA